MRYWHRPNFWFRLVALEVGAGVLTAVVVVLVSLGCHMAGTTDSFSSTSCSIVGVALFVILSCLGIRETTNEARMREEAQLRGFAMIPADAPGDAGHPRIATDRPAERSS
jgi:hypothetical protein